MKNHEFSSKNHEKKNRTRALCAADGAGRRHGDAEMHVVPDDTAGEDPHRGLRDGLLLRRFAADLLQRLLLVVAEERRNLCE